MRVPTPMELATAWWREALAFGQNLDAVPQEPQAGFYKRRFVRGGIFVPVKFWIDSEVDHLTGELMADEKMLCDAMGQWADADEQWSHCAANPISEAEFDYLTASIAWTRQNAPHEPMANVRQAVDWLKVPTPSFT